MTFLERPNPSDKQHHNCGRHWEINLSGFSGQKFWFWILCCCFSPESERYSVNKIRIIEFYLAQCTAWRRTTLWCFKSSGTQFSDYFFHTVSRKWEMKCKQTHKKITYASNTKWPQSASLFWFILFLIIQILCVVVFGNIYLIYFSVKGHRVQHYSKGLSREFQGTRPQTAQLG